MIRVMARRKYLSDCKDACPGLLSLSFSDIDGSLASPKARSRSFVNKTTTYVDVSYQTFAFLRTCFLYYNLCLCKSFKEHALRESASKVCHPVREAVISHLRVQRYAFSWNWQNFSRLFSKKDAFSYCIHYILYTRARGREGRGAMASLHTGRRGGEEGAR